MSNALLTNASISTRIDLLSAWIEAQLAYRGQPGLSVGIVYDQELVWAKGFGFADVAGNEKATPQTLYRIASITKLFTSTAILQLRDAGKLQLDDPITRHLPWFSVQNAYESVQNAYEDAPPITIRHLLTHTSGLPREAAAPYWTDNVFPTTDEIRHTVPTQETALPTETRWKYSNLALSLAGQIVETVSDMAYPTYIQQKILNPLEMGSTFVAAVPPDHPLLATGYGRRMTSDRRDVMPHSDCEGITPAANMASNVEDLAKFAMLQFRDSNGPCCLAHGNQILRGSTLREMQRIHWLEPEWTGGWGLGFHIKRYDDKTRIGHGGALQGYRTQFQLCPADKIGVIVLTNADDGEPQMYVDRTYSLVAQAIETAMSPKLEPNEVDPAWQKYVGKYRSVWRDAEVLILDNQLVMVDPSQPDPMQTLSKLIPVSTHTFRTDTEFGTLNHGEPAIFDIDGNGRAIRLTVGVNYSERIEEW